MGLLGKVKQATSPKRQRSNKPTSQKSNDNDDNKNTDVNANDSKPLGANSPKRIQQALKQRKQFATEANLNFRLLAFAGGVAVILTSIESLLICFYDENYLKVFIYLYTLIFGWIICLLEGHFIRLESIQNARALVIEIVPVLKYLYGRGIFYSISGFLQLSELSPTNILTGLFLVVVGIIFVMIGWHTKKRLSKLKKCLKDPRKLKKHFRKYDKDRDNYLDKDEFGEMIVGITDQEMDEDELEGAFAVMDTKNKGYVTLEEFTTWFRGFDASEKDEETGGGYSLM